MNATIETLNDGTPCCLCGGTDRAVHRYGQIDAGFDRDATAKPRELFACQCCDPIVNWPSPAVCQCGNGFTAEHIDAVLCPSCMAREKAAAYQYGRMEDGFWGMA